MGKLSMSQNVTKIETIKTNHIVNMEKLLDDLIIGFDCSVPLNLTSHSFETIKMCNEDIDNVTIQEQKMQILQKSSSFTVKAKSCSLRRTQKSNYCGNYDHGIALDSNGYTYNTQIISPEECQKYHDEREVNVRGIGAPLHETRRFKLHIGKENVYQYYKRGKTYPHTDVLGSQISCEGRTKMVDGKNIANIVEHVEDHLTLELNQLLMNDGKIVDKKRNRILNCKPEDNHCYYGNTIYIWDKVGKPNCDLYEAKEEVSGIMSTSNNLKYFSSNSSRIHLQITKKVSKCGRVIFETEFKDIYLLPLESQARIPQFLPSLELSIFKAYSIQDSFLYNKLAHLIKNEVTGLASHHCKDNVLSTRQWTKIITKARTNKLQPFSLYPESDQFFLPLGEGIYSFRCKKNF